MAKANEEAFDTLHELVTNEFTNRVRLGSECTTADLKGAADWLKANNVTGVAVEGSPLAALIGGLTAEDQDFVQRLVQ